MKSKQVARGAALLVVGGLLAWMLARLHWDELGRRLIDASPFHLALMLAAWLAAMLLRPARFRYLLAVLGHVQGINYSTIWAAIALGAAVNSFAPIRAGDVVFAVFLRQRLRIDMHKIFTVMVADWACDFVCIAVVFLGALSFAPAIAAWSSHAIAILLAILLVGVVTLWGLLRYRRKSLALLALILGRVAPRRQSRLLEIAGEVLTNLSVISNWKSALPLLAISMLIWGFVGLSYWEGLRAVVPGASPAGATFNMAAVTLSVVVPLGPAGLGSFEAVSVLSLGVFGVPLEGAIAFAIIAHAMQLACVVVFAGVAVLTRQIDYSSFRTPTTKE